MCRDSTALEQAQQAYEDSKRNVGVFDLLSPSVRATRRMHREYVASCLADVQRLCEMAWARGEIGPPGQAELPWKAKESP